MPSQGITSKLLRWYRKNGRDLPWRKTCDPYRILVSEVMLQQTQVSRVIDFYSAWLKQFPDWKTLAKASNAEVIRAWSGLGYNRRALVLRDIARQIVQEGIPKSEQEWLQLKGIGPYTASAVTLFSAKKRTFPVDTNTRRVIGRIFLKQLFPDPKHDASIRDRGMELVKKTSKYRDFIQALFDLANAYCKKRPLCESCPLKDSCSSAQIFLSGKGVVFPKQITKKAHERKHSHKPFPDRIYRGRILKVVQESRWGVSLTKLGPTVDRTFNTDLDSVWLKAIVSRLEKDGMVIEKNNSVKLYA